MRIDDFSLVLHPQRTAAFVRGGAAQTSAELVDKDGFAKVAICALLTLARNAACGFRSARD
jgi:hypothetical protein